VPAGICPAPLQQRIQVASHISDAVDPWLEEAATRLLEPPANITEDRVDMAIPQAGDEKLALASARGRWAGAWAFILEM